MQTLCVRNYFDGVSFEIPSLWSTLGFFFFFEMDCLPKEPLLNLGNQATSFFLSG